MIKLYRKNYDYELKTTKECLIGKLRNSTFQGLFNYYKHYKDYTFYGKIFEENFEIISVPASSRRSLFNPLIIGKFSSKSNKTVLSINMKLPSSDYIFIGMFFVACVFCGAIIYSCSLENSNLIPLIFILPFTIFLLVNALFFFFAKMNFSDAIYNIENILKECIIIDDKVKP